LFVHTNIIDLFFFYWKPFLEGRQDNYKILLGRLVGTSS